MALEAAAEQPRSPLVRLLAFLGPDYTLFLVFLTGLVVLGVLYGAHYIWREGPIYLSATAALAGVAVRFASDGRGIVMNRPGARRDFGAASIRILRDWGPLLLLAIVFENLETYTALLQRGSLDDALYRMDLRIFGVEPTVWMSNWNIPILTDWMAFAYGQYLVTPLILAVFLLVRGRRADFRELSTAVIIEMCAGFIGFVMFPAGPPRFYDALLHPAAGVTGFDPTVLHSYFGLYEFQQGGFDTVDPLMTRSAFPSLHCALGLLTLVYGWRFSDAVWPRFPRFFAWTAAILSVSLWLSTIYLRHHWVPDCFAGFVLGAFALWASPMLRRIWPEPTAAPVRAGVGVPQADSAA